MAIYWFFNQDTFFFFSSHVALDGLFWSYPDSYCFQWCIQNPLNWMLAEPVWNMTFGHWALLCAFQTFVYCWPWSAFQSLETAPGVPPFLKSCFMSRTCGLGIRSYLFTRKIGCHSFFPDLFTLKELKCCGTCRIPSTFSTLFSAFSVR